VNLHVWLTLAVVVIGVAAFWLAMKMAERKGAAAEQVKQHEDVAHAVEQHKTIENSVRALPRDDARERLRKWSRD
jgi:deoxyinosine 3'endonuclease (endonuclease V)